MVSEKNRRYLGNLSVFSAIGIKPFNSVFIAYTVFVFSLVLRFVAHIITVFYVNIPTRAIENGQSMPFWYARVFNLQEFFVLFLALISAATLYLYIKIRQQSQFSFIAGISSLWVASILFNVFHLLHLNLVTNQVSIGFFNQIIFNTFNLIPLVATAIFLFNSHHFKQSNRPISLNSQNIFIIISGILASFAIICMLVTFTFGTLVNRSSFWIKKWYRQAKLDMPYRVYKPTYITKNNYPSKFQNLTEGHECGFEYLNPRQKSTILIRQSGVSSEFNITEVFANRYKNNMVDAREIDFSSSKNNKAYITNATQTNTKTISFISPVDVQISVTSQVSAGVPQITDEELIKIAQSLK